MEKKKRKVHKDSSDYHEIIECITSALDAKDPYTAHHSKRVSEMALVVCNLLGFREEQAFKVNEKEMQTTIIITNLNIC